MNKIAPIPNAGDGPSEDLKADTPASRDQVMASLRFSLQSFQAEPVVHTDYLDAGDTAFSLGRYTLYFSEDRYCIDIATSSSGAGSPGGLVDVFPLDTTFPAASWRSALAHMIALWAVDQADTITNSLQDAERFAGTSRTDP